MTLCDEDAGPEHPLCSPALLPAQAEDEDLRLSMLICIGEPIVGCAPLCLASSLLRADNLSGPSPVGETCYIYVFWQIRQNPRGQSSAYMQPQFGPLRAYNTVSGPDTSS